MNSAHSSFVSVGGVSKLLSMSRWSRLSMKSWHTLSALSIILERTTGLDRCLLSFLWSESGARKWCLSFFFSYTEYKHNNVKGAHTLNAVARFLSLNTPLLLRNVLQKTDAGCSPVVLYTNDTEGNIWWKYEWNHRDGGNTCVSYSMMCSRVRSDQWKHASHPVHKVCSSEERRCLGQLNQTSAGSSGSRTTPPDKANSVMAGEHC